MKINIHAEVDGKEVVELLVLPLLKAQNITAVPEDVKIQVWSEKGQKFIDFLPEHVKFIFDK